MTLGLSSYSSLNGLGLITGATGGYGYYGGFGSDTYASYAKQAIANNYDVQTTQQSYSNMQNTESMTFTLQCQTIKNMIQSGRSDDALCEFNNLVDDMAGLSQYANYSEQQLKTLALNAYTSACNSTLLGDIERYADSSFTTGAKNSIPLLNLLMQTNSKSDFVAEVTGTNPSNLETVKKIGGAAVGGAAFLTLAKGAKAVHSGIKSTASTGTFKNITTEISKAFKGKTGKVALIGAAIGVACLGVKWLINKMTKND